MSCASAGSFSCSPWWAKNVCLSSSARLPPKSRKLSLRLLPTPRLCRKTVPLILLRHLHLHQSLLLVNISYRLGPSAAMLSLADSLAKVESWTDILSYWASGCALLFSAPLGDVARGELRHDALMLDILCLLFFTASYLRSSNKFPHWNCFRTSSIRDIFTIFYLPLILSYKNRPYIII